MELAHSYEHNYLFELQAYKIVFLNFKYEPPSFVCVEIGTNSRVPTTLSMVQFVTKPVNPLRGGNHTFTCSNFYYTCFNDHCCQSTMEGGGRSNKKEDELVNPSFIILNSR